MLNILIYTLLWLKFCNLDDPDPAVQIGGNLFGSVICGFLTVAIIHAIKFLGFRAII